MSIRKINRIKRKQSQLGTGSHWCYGCDGKLVNPGQKCTCGHRACGDQVKKRDYYFDEEAA